MALTHATKAPTPHACLPWSAHPPGKRKKSYRTNKRIVCRVPDARLLVQQPADDGDAQEAERGHDVGNAGVRVAVRVALVLQLQPRRAQVELRGAVRVRAGLG